MDTLRQDIRYAVRRLIKSPVVTAVALVTLALGIGANTAIFTVVNTVLLKPLPYRDPDQIVGVYHLSDGRRATMSGPNFYDVRKQSRTLQDGAAISRNRTILTGHGEPVRLDSAEVSASLFDILGVQPILGRTFRADDNAPAFHSTGGGLASALKEGGRGALSSRAGSRVRTTLVVSEIALAVTLLAGAGLLVRSFTKLAAVDPGFEVQPALAFDLTLPDARYAEEPQQVAFFDQLLPKLEAVLGVEAASAVMALPLTGGSIVLTFEVAGRPPVPRRSSQPWRSGWRRPNTSR